MQFNHCCKLFISPEGHTSGTRNRMITYLYFLKIKKNQPDKVLEPRSYEQANTQSAKYWAIP